MRVAKTPCSIGSPVIFPPVRTSSHWLVPWFSRYKAAEDVGGGRGGGGAGRDLVPRGERQGSCRAGAMQGYAPVLASTEARRRDAVLV